jgi:hypothetical protein
MAVSVMFGSPPIAARIDSRSHPFKRSISPLKTLSALPSEGRGRWFESDWVRQFSAISETVPPKVLALRFELRSFVLPLFTEVGL